MDPYYNAVRAAMTEPHKLDFDVLANIKAIVRMMRRWFSRMSPMLL